MVDIVIKPQNQITKTEWNKFVADSPWGHLMQTWEWGTYKQALGWILRRIALERGGKIVAGAQIFLRPLPWLPLKIAYIPKGPLLDLADEETATKLFAAIHQLVQQQKAIFLKIEPNILDDEQAHILLKHYGFRASIHTNQPRSTIIIDLHQNQETLLKNMRRKTRQLVRRAARDGVEIINGKEDDLNSFYETIFATSKAKGISSHNQKFYYQAWQTFRATNSIKLLLAKYQEKVVAAKMICVFDDRSMHLWGGTSDEGRKVNASYLIQWEAIKWALNQGCAICDLWGIPDEIAEMLKSGIQVPKDRQDGLWGVFHFKRGFGGQIENYVGAYDYPYKPLLYWLGTKLIQRRQAIDVLSHHVTRFSA